MTPAPSEGGGMMRHQARRQSTQTISRSFQKESRAIPHASAHNTPCNDPKFLAALLLLVLCAPLGAADWISVNAGGTGEVVVIPAEEIEGFFWGLAPAPAPVSPAAPGGGHLPALPPSRGRVWGAPYDVRIMAQAAQYGPGDNVSILIRINNTGRTPDADARLYYYLRAPDGTVWDEAAESDLEVEPGVTVFARTLALPSSAEFGQWKAFVVYNVTRLDPIPAVDTVYVERRPWRMDWFMAVVIGVVIVAVGAFALGVRRGRRTFSEEEEKEEDDEEAEKKTP